MHHPSAVDVQAGAHAPPASAQHSINDGTRVTRPSESNPFLLRPRKLPSLAAPPHRLRSLPVIKAGPSAACPLAPRARTGCAPSSCSRQHNLPNPSLCLLTRPPRRRPPPPGRAPAPARPSRPRARAFQLHATPLPYLPNPSLCLPMRRPPPLPAPRRAPAPARAHRLHAFQLHAAPLPYLPPALLCVSHALAPPPPRTAPRCAPPPAACLPPRTPTGCAPFSCMQHRYLTFPQPFFVFPTPSRPRPPPPRVPAPAARSRAPAACLPPLSRCPLARAPRLRPLSYIPTRPRKISHL
ncbi:hypothetical protein FB451DRAFT_1394575 [Mycena latifolia]|nr:hypothetical protein FB451DRAFT_1394575 [Mycena latifolia]